MIERPLDFLNERKGKKVLVKLKNNDEISGLLIAFDMHINILIETKKNNIMFLRGDFIINIS